MSKNEDKISAEFEVKMKNPWMTLRRKTDGKLYLYIDSSSLNNMDDVELQDLPIKVTSLTNELYKLEAKLKEDGVL